MPHIVLIEIGTNTTKFAVATNTRPLRIVYFTKEMTRIGEGLARQRRLAAPGVRRTVAAISKFTGYSRRRFPRSKVFAIATYALRRATNARETIAAIERAAGCPLRILSGHDEAVLAHASARERLPLERPYALIIDVGGGSTEVVIADRKQVRAVRSAPMGALHLTERFVKSDPPRPEDARKAAAVIARTWRAELTAVGARRLAPARVDLIASGGSATTLARMLHPRRRRLHGDALRVRLGKATTLLQRCLEMSVAERRRLPGLEPERADIIPMGIAILVGAMRETGKRVLWVNPGGVREGALVHLIENNLKWSL